MTESELAAHNGRVAVVTGGAKGIGRAYVDGLAGAGYAVMIADLTSGDALVEELSARGASVASVSADVSEPEATEHIAEATLETFGRIDALVNNAGYFTEIRKKPFDELSVAEWDKAYRVNVLGTWLCIKAVVPSMREQGYGKIVNTSSMVVPTGIPGFLHYVASKSAVVGLTRALARELGESGIAVNTVSPDYIPHDEGYAARQPEMARHIACQRCFQRDQVPEDMIGTILYLLGPGSDFVTGQNIHVNGGRWFS